MKIPKPGVIDANVYVSTLFAGLIGFPKPGLTQVGNSPPPKAIPLLVFGSNKPGLKAPPTKLPAPVTVLTRSPSLLYINPILGLAKITIPITTAKANGMNLKIVIIQF